MSFAARLRDNLEKQGERIALRFEGRQTSFAELAAQAEDWRRFLDQLEVGPGARVLFMLESGPELVAVHLGNLLAGRISVPVNPRAKAPEIARILEVAEPTLVVVAAAAKTEVSKALLQTGSTAHLLEERFIAAAFSAGARSPSLPAPMITADDPAMIVFTSGTTGAPKGATLSQRNLLAGIEALEVAWSLTDDDHLYLALPLFHVHGLGLGIHGMLALGHAVTLERRFDAAEALAALDDRGRGISLFYGVPTLYHRLVEAATRPLALPLRLAVSGSAPLPAALHATIRERLGVDVLERYGMSETFMLCSNPLMDERRAGSVGLPLPGVELTVVDEQGEGVAPGEEGEIRLRGPNVFTGYWRDPEATAAAFDAAGRFRSGDLGRIDPESGHLLISGRLKELIISGGFNVHPREVEEAILDWPGIRECAVAGLPDADLGECVTAYIVADEDFDLEALKGALESRMSGTKRPRRYVLVDALPRNAMGKLARHRLGEATS